MRISTAGSWLLFRAEGVYGQKKIFPPIGNAAQLAGTIGEYGAVRVGERFRLEFLNQVGNGAGNF